MARKLRLQFPGALYHVMSRGDRREPIFRNDQDRESFLRTLEEACAKTGWRVHAFCLLPDHFHLVIETPQANLATGMKWFLGTYTTRFNRRHQTCGHVFSGRYRSSIIGPKGGYLRAVCAYVHLNPVRAGLLKQGDSLESYPWSSFPCYVGSNSNDQSTLWLSRSRLLDECGIRCDSPNAGELYKQSLLHAPSSSQASEFASIRTAWFFGDDAYRRELLSRIEKESGTAHFGSELQEASEAKARRIIDEELHQAVWTHAELLRRRKGDPWKIALAQRLRAETTVTLQWIANQLHMGTRTHLSHLLYWSRRAKSSSASSMRELKAATKLRKLRPKTHRTPPITHTRTESDSLMTANKPDQILTGHSTIPGTDPSPFEFDTRFD